MKDWEIPGAVRITVKSLNTHSFICIYSTDGAEL